MKNSTNRVDILHVAPQPEGHDASICAVTNQLQNEFSTAYANVHIETVKPSDGIPLPQDLEKFSGLVVSGSLHSTYEPNLPWMPALEELIQSSHDRKLATLGSCFGHQAIAQALGGTVEGGTQGLKLGQFPVHLTEAGEQDPLYQNVGESFFGTSWHNDIVTELPPEAVELATAARYRTQSFGVGEHLRTTQFHPEFSVEVFEKILADSPPSRSPHYPAGVSAEQANKGGSTILQNFMNHFVLKSR